NLIQVDKEERITAVIPRKEIENEKPETDEEIETVEVEIVENNENAEVETVDVGYIMMATKFGLIKKTALKEFNSIRKGGKIAISLLPGDELISVQLTDGENEILIGSHEGKCIRFSEHDVRAMGRDTQGVRSIDLNDGDYVIDMQVIRPTDTVITISSNGYGKRSSIDEYRLQSRAGKGIKAGVFNEKTGFLVGIKPVNEDQDIMMISDQGVAIRTQVNEISLIGRDTQGVRVMKLNGAQIATIAIAPHEDEEEEEFDEDGNPIIRDEEGNIIENVDAQVVVDETPIEE
ncbi:MAG: hypothetical protein IKA99_03240, partial [Clostridia bacterium]|nr:hypothetical protein [Clostridia bacterium]